MRSLGYDGYFPCYGKYLPDKRPVCIMEIRKAGKYNCISDPEVGWNGK